jgi:site-specific recombinase XerD
MQNTLAGVNPSPLSASLAEIADRASEYAEHSKADATLKAYKSDWRDFLGWCKANQLSPIPAEPTTLALYLAACAESLKVSTLQRRLASIAAAHRIAGFESPTSAASVQAVWQGIRRSKGLERGQKQAILKADLQALLSIIPETLKGQRDRALLLLGFTGAFRRSELLSLRIEDFSLTQEGIVLRVRKSKTDQEGRGMLKAIPYSSDPILCPVRHLQAWITAAQIIEGPIFRRVNKANYIFPEQLTPQSLTLTLKAYAKIAGLDPKRIASHSLRAGFVTQAALNGASERAIMNQTGHKSRAMVDVYVRRATVWQENAATKLGL